ncbi:MAG: bifunctional pirin family protein/GNAT family N-acetyltransferase [Leucobacter sp.]
MSNLEHDPTETICAEPEDTHVSIEVLEPREVPLGGLRAMTVRRTLPQRARSLIGAWCFLDHYGPNDVAVSGPMDVAAHPHTGLQTASWVFSGTIEHRDSAGNHAIVRPGELNLMTAGSGISHSERTTPDTKVLHGVQLWIALPDRTRHTVKRFNHYAPPTVTGEGYRAQVFLGTLLGNTSPVEADTPLVGAEVTLEPGAVLRLAVDPTHEHGVLVDQGDVMFARGSGATDSPGVGLPTARLGFSPTGTDTLMIHAGGEGARIMLIGGEPLGEQLVMWWNFVGRSHEEIIAAREAWQSTIAGTAGANDWFGIPDDEPAPPLPAPAAPTARLKPRGHLPPLPTDQLAQMAQSADSNDAGAAAIHVKNVPDERRYTITVDGVLAGFAEYRPTASGTGVAFVHTEIAPEFGGRGLAGKLVSWAMNDVRDSGSRIVPYCPYVAAWLKKHPEFEEIVDWPNV